MHSPHSILIAKNSIFRILFASSFLELLGLGIAIPIFAPLFMRESSALLPQGTPEEVRTVLYGLVIAAYPIAQFFGTPVVGSMSDHYGRKPLLIITRLGTLASYLLIALGIGISNVWVIIAGRLIDGFTGGNISVVQSAISDITSGKDRSKGFGLIGMAFGFGFIFGPMIGGLLSDSHLYSGFTYATPFLAAACVTAVNVLFVALRMPETLKNKKAVDVHPLKGFTGAFRGFANRKFRMIFIVWFLYVSGFNFFTQFFQVYLVSEFHITQTQIGLLFGYTGFFIAIAQGFTNRILVSKFSSHQILFFGMPVLSFALMSLLLPTQFLYFFAIMPFIANAQGVCMPNLTSAISHKADDTEQGKILGISQAVQSLGMAFPPILAGFLAAIHISLPLLCASILIAIAWIIFLCSEMEQVVAA